MRYFRFFGVFTRFFLDFLLEVFFHGQTARKRNFSIVGFIIDFFFFFSRTTPGESGSEHIEVITLSKSQLRVKLNSI